MGSLAIQSPQSCSMGSRTPAAPALLHAKQRPMPLRPAPQCRLRQALDLWEVGHFSRFLILHGAAGRPVEHWFGLLLWTTLWPWVRVCSLLGSCVALSVLLRCRLRLVLRGVAPSCSAPLEVLRPKPRWGKAWSPIWFLFWSSTSQLAQRDFG
jgi:hypothetical protein